VVGARDSSVFQNVNVGLGLPSLMVNGFFARCKTSGV